MTNNKYKILLVEDDGSIRSIMTTMLESAGYQVIPADTCGLAKTLFASHLPDVTILDLGLPDMDGMRMLEFVRKDSLSPILVLSARNDDEDKVLALDAGANDYVTKPFSSAELLARIRMVLRNYQHRADSGKLPRRHIPNADAADRLRRKAGVCSRAGGRPFPDGIQYSGLSLRALRKDDDLFGDYPGNMGLCRRGKRQKASGEHGEHSQKIRREAGAALVHCQRARRGLPHEWRQRGMKRFFRVQSPARLISLGFAATILLGSALLMLPCSVRDGAELKYIDALYTSTSAVCVTGLIAVDAGDTFTSFGQVILALLIQIGGLGITSIGAGIMLAMGKKLDLKSRRLIQEASNLDSNRGAVRFIRSVLRTTLIFELAGAILSFFVFVQDYPPLRAMGISLFHSVAAFNNSGFDILGNFQNLIPYQNSVMLNLTTCGLVFFGGIGFLVIREMVQHKLKWRKYSMHAKVVLSVSGALILAGTLLLKATEDISWLGALFHSVSARTAGFSTYPLKTFSNAGLLALTALMFIGASPGSTGGGIKTSTFLALIQGMKAAATNQSEKAFHNAIPRDAFRKAAVITLLAMAVVVLGTWAMALLEPQVPLMDALFEVTSAFGTVGLSTGITPSLGVGAKLLSILIMYIGRLGPLTVASLWYFSRGERISYPEGNLSIG